MKRLFSALSLGLLFLFFVVPQAFAQTVVFSQKEVQLGSTVQFTLGPLPDTTQTYRLTISDKNGTANFFSMNIQTQQGQDCKDPTPSGPFVKGSGLGGKWCETHRDVSNKRFHAYSVGIDTNKLNYDPRFFSFTYSLLINNTKPSGAEFTVINNNPPQLQFQLDLSSPNEPSADTFYEDTKVDVAATGCQSGSKVNFRWWRGPNSAVKTCATNETSNKCDGKDGDSKSLTADNLGSATFCKGGDCPSGDDGFGSDQGSIKSEEYIIRAVCEATGQIDTSTFFLLSRDDDDDATVSVDGPVKVNTPFNVNLDQLQDGVCYYYKIRSTTGHFFQPSANGEIRDCGNDEDTNHRLDNQENVYKASKGWAPAWGSPVNTTHDTTTNESYTGLPEGTYEIELFRAVSRSSSVNEITTSEQFCVGTGPKCQIETELPPPPVPCEIGEDAEGNTINTTTITDPVTKGAEQDKIVRCTGVRTPFGVFGVAAEDFIPKLFAILLSLSGGIALLLIIYSGYQLIFSQGDPEKVKAARERLTSAIIGLLFLIFSVVILEIIGVDILQLPGFER